MKLGPIQLSPKQLLGVIVLAAAVVVAIVLLVRQNMTSEEARIRKLIKEVERAFEERKLKNCLAVAADDYSDNFGHSSKAQLERDLRLLFQVTREIHADLDVTSIDIRSDEADISITAAVSAETHYGDMSLTREVGYTHFVLAIRKDRGRWKVFRAEGVD